MSAAAPDPVTAAERIVQRFAASIALATAVADATDEWLDFVETYAVVIEEGMARNAYRATMAAILREVADRLDP